MSDREKVIKGFECHISTHCVECPYRKGWATCSASETLFADVLALLKEQKETPFTCSMCSKHTENGFCNRWKTNVKDDDYCSFGEGR